MKTASLDQLKRLETAFVGQEKEMPAAQALDGRIQTRAEPVRSENTLPDNFHSILFETPGDGNPGDKVQAPACFGDLYLDQIVDAITAGRDEYDLKPFFHVRLTNLTAISYRQQIMQDLEHESLFKNIKSFAEQMRVVRGHLATAKNRDYQYSKERWFLDAAVIYCEAVENLRRDLNQFGPDSRGLLAFQKFLAQYVASKGFTGLFQEAKKLQSELSVIRYCLLLKDGGFTVRQYDSEIDYTAVIEKAFAKFRQGEVKDYRVKPPDSSGMSHVEAAALERVARLNPGVFHALDDFCAKHGNFPEKTIADFDREIQFYIAYLEYLKTFKRTGLKFCYPQVSGTCKEVNNREGFDLALAGKLVGQNLPVVCNDFGLSGPERLFVATGPNQGGKTTFARTFGQLHYLASLGCPVPGSEAKLFLFDQLFTHFEREEDITTLHGKLQDDLVRIHRILERATPQSIVIINEIFSSTSLQDGVRLGERILTRLSQLDALCVCVTFLDELASLNEKTVSIVATVQPDNPTLRTYKLERKRADGLAYALALAKKYRLTHERLKERIQP